MNVSENGLALPFWACCGRRRSDSAVRASQRRATNLSGEGAVIWNDSSGMGLRFLRIEPGCRSMFRAWLDSWKRSLQFRESVQAIGLRSVHRANDSISALSEGI